MPKPITQFHVRFFLPTELYTSLVLEQCVTAAQTKTSGHIIAPAYIHIAWRPICTHIPTAKIHTQYECSQCKTRYVLLQPGKQFAFITYPCLIPITYPCLILHICKSYIQICTDCSVQMKLYLVNMYLHNTYTRVNIYL